LQLFNHISIQDVHSCAVTSICIIITVTAQKHTIRHPCRTDTSTRLVRRQWTVPHHNDGSIDSIVHLCITSTW